MSTNSLGEHSLASRVKPTMSAYSTLGRADCVSGAGVSAHVPSHLPSFLIPHSLVPLDIEAVEVVGALWP